MIDDVVAALAHPGREYLRSVELETHRIVLAVAIVASGKQQGACVLLLEQRPATQRAGAAQKTAERHGLTSQHHMYLLINRRRWR